MAVWGCMAVLDRWAQPPLSLLVVTKDFALVLLGAFAVISLRPCCIWTFPAPKKPTPPLIISVPGRNMGTERCLQLGGRNPW